MVVQRDASAGTYWRSEYLHLAKLLMQAASFGKVVSYASRKRCHSWRILGVKIPLAGEIADPASEFWESCELYR